MKMHEIIKDAVSREDAKRVYGIVRFFLAKGYRYNDTFKIFNKACGIELAEFDGLIREGAGE